MKKKVKFRINNSNAYALLDKVDKFGLQLTILSKEAYTFNEMNQIINQLNEKGIEFTIDFKNEKRGIVKDYKNCGECEYYNSERGCENEKSKVRSKNLKTKNSKGCYWGKWN